MTSGHHVAVDQAGHVRLHLVVVDRLPVGRSGTGLRLDDERISRQHCELYDDAGSLLVRDLGSTNGTTVNGRPLDGPVRLRTGDVVGLGDSTITVASPATDEPALPDDVRRTSLASRSSQGPPTSASPAVDDDDEHRLRASIVGTTLTIVLSDIIGSTTMVHELGDRRWFEVLSRHDQLTREQLVRYHGAEVKAQGDGFLMTFPSARHGLLFALGLQEALSRERSEVGEFGVHVRVGVHTGEVLHASGDVFGRHVHFAARVSAQAGADEVIASSLVRQLAEPMGDLSFDSGRIVELKGFGGEHTVHRVVAAPSSDAGDFTPGGD